MPRPAVSRSRNAISATGKDRGDNRECRIGFSSRTSESNSPHHNRFAGAPLLSASRGVYRRAGTLALALCTIHLSKTTAQHVSFGAAVYQGSFRERVRTWGPAVVPAMGHQIELPELPGYQKRQEVRRGRQGA